ncbi:SDR family NAD(P)-dependent oxidoreductase [Novosphingobium bradum]|uniref:SDR family NAD(P)-dependent oxidoreductase n=1 Tax=Novosphingobium bradum TaxID=1737444 RepID=A0ABV7IP80_9SPHN
MALTDETAVPDYASLLRLDGRGVVVLGAGQGIGRQAAHACAALGARVACIDAAPDRAESVAAEVGGVAFAADVTDRAAVDRVLGEAAAALGRMDAMIDIIGMPKYIPILDLTDEDWDFQFDLSLRQAFYAMRAAGRIMRASGGGAMAFVSSISGTTGAPRHAPYGAAKAGLDSLVRSAGNELARHGIRVNAAAPGLTWTPRISASLDAEALAPALKSIPLRRPGQPADIAGTLLFLISDLSAYITGQTIIVDGGATTGFPIALGAGPGVKRPAG